jgi:hypothetical protein
MFGIRFASKLVRGRGQHLRNAARYLPTLEKLEDRRLLSFNEFTVPPKRISVAS